MFVFDCDSLLFVSLSFDFVFAICIVWLDGPFFVDLFLIVLICFDACYF